MERTACKTKLSQQKCGRELKRVAAGKHPAVAAIPEVVGIVVVAVQPQAIVVPFNVEHLEVAVRVRNV